MIKKSRKWYHFCLELASIKYVQVNSLQRVQLEKNLTFLSLVVKQFKNISIVNSIYFGGK